MISKMLVNKLSANSALILAFHRINTREYIAKTKLMPGMYISNEAFSAQISWLKNYFEIVNIEKIIRGIRYREKWREPICAITFDDGWFDNYEYAFPVLRENKVPWTIFITGKDIGCSELNCFDMCFEIAVNLQELPADITRLEKIDKLFLLKEFDPVGKGRRIINEIRKLPGREFDIVYSRLKEFFLENVNNFDINMKYRKMTWENMKEMQEYGSTFGYHSRSHYMLMQLEKDKLEEELIIPKEIARNHGVSIENIFCYPDGGFNDDIIRLLKELGYEGAASLITGYNNVETDPYKLKRFNIHEGSGGSLGNFLYTISRE
jgi:peptidoglycan/xylan/chitin deacetylase (PgdA/CDA1 family)